VQTGTAPVDALQSAVYDQNYNRMVATLVRYRILSGEALFTANSAQNGTVSADGQTITVLTDKDGRASVRPIAAKRLVCQNNLRSGAANAVDFSGLKPANCRAHDFHRYRRGAAKANFWEDLKLCQPI